MSEPPHPGQPASPKLALSAALTDRNLCPHSWQANNTGLTKSRHAPSALAGIARPLPDPGSTRGPALAIFPRPPYSVSNRYSTASSYSPLSYRIRKISGLPSRTPALSRTSARRNSGSQTGFWPSHRLRFPKRLVYPTPFTKISLCHIDNLRLVLL